VHWRQSKSLYGRGRRETYESPQTLLWLTRARASVHVAHDLVADDAATPFAEDAADAKGEEGASERNAAVLCQ